LPSRPAPASVTAVEIIIVKGDAAGADDRTRIIQDGEPRRVAVHVLHDLPHLVVESLFGLDGGLWGELAAGKHGQANLAAGARDPKRRKQGRIVSGAATGAATGEWLSVEHRRAKTVTNAVLNRWGDGPDTPTGVRGRLAGGGDPAIDALLARLTDKTIEAAIRGVDQLFLIWAETPPGGSLRLNWPLSPEYLMERRPIRES
jgi:hypothetical protein